MTAISVEPDRRFSIQGTLSGAGPIYLTGHKGTGLLVKMAFPVNGRPRFLFGTL